jgi:hypothetical protein
MAKKIQDLPIKIKDGIPWTVKFYRERAYVKEYGNDSAAITESQFKRIGINLDVVLPSEVRHEIFHAYLAECNIESANLTAEQVEEVAASVVGDYALDIIKIADYILTHMHLNS